MSVSVRKRRNVQLAKWCLGWVVCNLPRALTGSSLWSASALSAYGPSDQEGIVHNLAICGP